jgi:hypothetical protein
VDDDAMKLGLLLESAHAHQRLAEGLLERLRVQVAELPGLARDEIRATMLEELGALQEDGRRAGETLRRLRYVADLRVALWTLAITTLSCAVPLGVAWWLLPSRAEVAALGARREALEAAVARLKAEGGEMEWRRCGSARRLCVRVDRKAGAFGESGDFLIVKAN